MNLLKNKIENFNCQFLKLKSKGQTPAAQQMPGNCYFLDNNNILCRPRDEGDSRYVYGQNGFNLWAYASGNIHCNEGLFSPFLRKSEGGEPYIAFFAGIPQNNKTNYPVPLLPTPAVNNPADSKFQKYTVFSPAAAYYITYSAALYFGLRVFTAADKKIYFSLQIQNNSATKQRFFISSYFNPFLRHAVFPTAEDVWFKEIKYLPAGGNRPGSFLIRVNEDKDRYHSVSNYALLRSCLSLDKKSKVKSHAASTARSHFTGNTNSSLFTPFTLIRGHYTRQNNICTFTETAAASDLIQLVTAPGSSLRYDMEFTYTFKRKKIDNLKNKTLNRKQIDTFCSKQQIKDNKKHANITVSIAQSKNDMLDCRNFNSFFEHLKRQIDFCALIKGYVQLSSGSLIGIRDVFQAVEALVFWQPQAGRKKMLEALAFMTPEGRCFRQYSLPTAAGKTGKMDLRYFIDQGTWVISTVVTYLRLTSDFNFLKEKCGFHEIVNEASGKVKKAKQKTSVLQHLLLVMDFLLKHRDQEYSGCIRAMFGDWNDALDGLGTTRDPEREYGSGVSIMVTLQVYQNLGEIIELLQHYNTVRNKKLIQRYQQARTELAQSIQKHGLHKKNKTVKIVHGWGDKMQYYVGSFKDADGKNRDGLTSYAFWVLSGMNQNFPGLKADILKAYNRLDSKYGLKTFTPFFAPDTAGLGRIGKLPAGTAENAAVYIHASLFAVMSLFEIGEARQGWEQLIKILPFTKLHKNLSHSPFVVPNSYGYNPHLNIDGQSMNDWQTGSSNVLMKLLIRFVFGFEVKFKNVYIQPAAYYPFASFTFNIVFRQTPVTIKYRNNNSGKRKFKLNKKQQKPFWDNHKNIPVISLPHNIFNKRKMVITVTD
ncbi:MAG TPA: hypothetical protein VKS21_02265 [Spirochaetota bacterium]|nr:hypothetical protein [Spirochaetota bacterium]